MAVIKSRIKPVAFYLLESAPETSGGPGVRLTPSVNKYLLNPGDISVDKADKILAPMELTFWWGDNDN